MKRKVAFIDRDGALIFEPLDTQQVNDISQLKILPGVIEGLQHLMLHSYSLVMVTNQDGLGTESYPLFNFNSVQEELFRRLALQGIEFEEVFVCPHISGDNCACRKPRLGMVRGFMRQTQLDFASSLMIGDRLTDGQFAQNLGVRFYKMETNGQFPDFRVEHWMTK